MAKRAVKAAPILKLVSSIPIRKNAPRSTEIHQDCIDELRNLLARAERGDLTGIAYVEMNNGRSYRVRAAGLAYENPTFCLGMVEVLKNYVLERVTSR